MYDASVELPLIVKAVILGVLEGLTEFLPISSTAHLIIAGRLLKYEDPGGVFKVMIQLGSILAVMWLYRARILKVITGLVSDPAARHFALMILAAFLPSLVAGAFLAGFVKSVLYESLAVVAVSFVLGGIVILVVERTRRAPRILEADQTPLARAIGIGFAMFVEDTGLGPYEGIRVRVDPAGRVFVFSGASSQGQAHETTLAQVVGDGLSVPIEQITVVPGDTAGIPYGVGTFASRVAVLASAFWLKNIDFWLPMSTRFASTGDTASAKCSASALHHQRYHGPG